MGTRDSAGLARTSTADGLYLHGYFAPAPGARLAVLHIHGFEGNFYENHFVHVLARRIPAAGLSFLSGNTRGSGRDTDFRTTDGAVRRVGARYELFEESHLDISGWIGFLREQGYPDIILQGHSLGTSKVLRYMFEGQYRSAVRRIVLLAPWDRAGFVKSLGAGVVRELLDSAAAKVKADRFDQLVAAAGLDLCG
ncbi:MAG: alpha/beta hydrolase, partial [Firmicutes bacterium]|nr:alpha/beta hydrolase [Bacillota bacterium]